MGSLPLRNEHLPPQRTVLDVLKSLLARVISCSPGDWPSHSVPLVRASYNRCSPIEIIIATVAKVFSIYVVLFLLSLAPELVNQPVHLDGLEVPSVAFRSHVDPIQIAERTPTVMSVTASVVHIVLGQSPWYKGFAIFTSSLSLHCSSPSVTV